MKNYTSDGRRMYEDANHGTFSKKLAAFAISLMKGKDTDTEKLAKITPRTVDEVREIMQKAKLNIPEGHDYTAQYLFNMAIADYPKTLKTDEQRATFVAETINDPDGDPASVLECFTAKMAVAGIPIRWEELQWLNKALQSATSNGM